MSAPSTPIAGRLIAGRLRDEQKEITVTTLVDRIALSLIAAHAH
ncbi:hypothetical protein [Gordonia oryzae]|nr:hypothetical protein [Gordonia oryzae]